MMQLRNALIVSIILSIAACSPIQTPITNQYTLEGIHPNIVTHHKSSYSILVSQPEAMAGYQTEQMHYVQKPFELDAFAHNAWISTPANMLYPLLIESLQKTDYFYAVVSGPYVDHADYRLDSQLISLQQNFLVKPSRIELVVKVMLTHIDDRRVVSSHIFTEIIPCPADTPYGGVIAANKATQHFTQELSHRLISDIQHDHEKHKSSVATNSKKLYNEPPSARRNT